MTKKTKSTRVGEGEREKTKLLKTWKKFWVVSVVEEPLLKEHEREEGRGGQRVNKPGRRHNG